MMSVKTCNGDKDSNAKDFNVIKLSNGMKYIKYYIGEQ